MQSQFKTTTLHLTLSIKKSKTKLLHFNTQKKKKRTITLSKNNRLRQAKEFNHIHTKNGYMPRGEKKLHSNKK